MFFREDLIFIHASAVRTSAPQRDVNGTSKWTFLTATFAAILEAQVLQTLCFSFVSPFFPNGGYHCERKKKKKKGRAGEEVREA